MDVCKSVRLAAVDTKRTPLVPAERNSNAATTTSRPGTRDINSRYKSPSPSTPSTRRCPSPNPNRTLSNTSQVVPKRAQSVERRRPSTPSSPTSPSTPVQDSSVNTTLSSRRLSIGSRLQESLWPSTMRSLNVSFQSDNISIRNSKKEKPVGNASSDRTLRPSLNVAHKQIEKSAALRKSTPERKRSPLKGKNAQDQSENAKPVDVLHSRLIDQHRWPSRIGGKVSSNPSNGSLDLTDKTMKALPAAVGIGLTSLGRMPGPDVVKPLQKSASDAASLSSLEEIRVRPEVNSGEDRLLQVYGDQKLVLPNLPGKILTIPVIRTQSAATPRSRPSSPSRTPISRGLSPVRTRPSTPPSSRGHSPSRIWPSSATSQSDSSTSVLSFISDFKKGKKGASHIEDAHQLRLLYNRYLQWRFANARAEAVLYIQKVTTEKTLCDVWTTTLALWDSVIQKRINLQQLKLELKLNAVLTDQMAYLDDWALLERDHINSLSGAVEDLAASILRLPVTRGAKVDTESLRIAICSAVDVMQAMASSMCSLLSRVEGMNGLVSELAVTAAREKAMLGECKALLASTAAMQAEEYSLRTHFMQIEQVLEKQSILAVKHLLSTNRLLS